MVAHCHKQVREIAKAAAGDLYEKLMGDNFYYETWRKQNPGANAAELERRFVEKNWGRCLDFARATLATMLRSPAVSDEMKEEIMDVLEKDAMLTRGRGRVPMSVVKH